MRVFRSKKTWAAATVGVAVVGTLATVALGSHAPFNFVGETPLVDRANFDEAVHLNSDRVKFQTKGPTDVRVQKNVFSVGGSSGWHHHPGVVLVAVQSGAVTLTHSDCSSQTYGPGLLAGSVFAEGGDDEVLATSTSGADVIVMFVVPNGDPFRIDAPHEFQPSCP